MCVRVRACVREIQACKELVARRSSISQSDANAHDAPPPSTISQAACPPSKIPACGQDGCSGEKVAQGMEGGGRGGGEAGFKEEQARVEKTLLRELRLPEDLCDSLAPISLAAGSEGGGGGGRMGGGQKKIAGEGKVTMESDALDANAVAVRKDGEGEDEVDVGEMAGKCLAALTACLGDSHMRFEEWDAVVDAGQRARARALTLRHARIMCKGSYLAG